MDPLSQLNAVLLDRYTVEHEIGQGGMATVYLARDLRHDRKVALKVLSPELGAVLGGERFLSEIRVTANLQHPNLLPLFDSGEANGLLYYVMPYVAGESLRARLDRERQLPIDEALRIADAVANALDYAHRQGVVHRDLKPENILLHDGQPLVADFGIALAVSKAGGHRITQTGLSLGTPHYMSPEQATGDRQVDARSDVYSLGAVVYEMLVGEPPHTGSTAQAIIARVLTERPRSIRSSRPSVPEEVEAAVLCAVEKLPADRWSTAREFADALRGKAVPRAAHTSRAATDAPLWRREWRVSTVALAASLALASVLAGASVWAARRTTTDGKEGQRIAFAVNFPAGEEFGNVFSYPLAVAPDGSAILFHARVPSGGTRLYLRRLGSLKSEPLPGTENSALPAFSRDGRWIAFTAAGVLKRMPVAGGPPVDVARGWFNKPTVMPDGSIIVTTRGLLGRIPPAGGAPTPLTTRDSAADERVQGAPVLLDDGETIAYTSFQTRSSNARIRTFSLRTGKVAKLDVPAIFALGVIDRHLIAVSNTGTINAIPVDLRAGKVTGAPVALIDGLRVQGTSAAAAFAGGTLAYVAGSSMHELVRVDTNGKARPVLPDRLGYGVPRVSPNGRLIAMSIGRVGLDDIWVHDTATGTMTRLSTDSTAGYPVWTPDGRFVIYTRGIAKKDAQIVRQPIDGSGPAESIISDKQFHYFTLHPDGSSILYTSDADSVHVQTWLRRITGDTTPRLLWTSRGEYGYQFSPDGKWLTYHSDESGGDQVYVRAFPGPGPRIQVSVEDGSEPRWSRDGRKLFYRGAERQQPGEPRRGKLIAASLQFAPGPVVTARRALFDDVFDAWWDVANYDVAPDGNGFIMVRNSSQDEQLVVIANWDREVRRILREQH